MQETDANLSYISTFPTAQYTTLWYGKKAQKIQKAPAQSSQWDSKVIDKKTPTDTVIGDIKFFQWQKA